MARKMYLQITDSPQNDYQPFFAYYIHHCDLLIFTFSLQLFLLDRIWSFGIGGFSA